MPLQAVAVTLNTPWMPLAYGKQREGSDLDYPSWAQIAATRLGLPLIPPPVYSDKKALWAYLDEEKGILYTTGNKGHRNRGKGKNKKSSAKKYELPRPEDRTEKHLAEITAAREEYVKTLLSLYRVVLLEEVRDGETKYILHDSVGTLFYGAMFAQLCDTIVEVERLAATEADNDGFFKTATREAMARLLKNVGWQFPVMKRV